MNFSHRSIARCLLGIEKNTLFLLQKNAHTHTHCVHVMRKTFTDHDVLVIAVYGDVHWLGETIKIICHFRVMNIDLFHLCRFSHFLPNQRATDMIVCGGVSYICFWIKNIQQQQKHQTKRHAYSVHHHPFSCALFFSSLSITNAREQQKEETPNK